MEKPKLQRGKFNLGIVLVNIDSKRHPGVPKLIKIVQHIFTWSLKYYAAFIQNNYPMEIHTCVELVTRTQTLMQHK